MVDIVLAVIITSVALTAVAALFVPATVNYSNAADYTAAVNLAQKQLELLKVRPSSVWAAESVPCSIEWQDVTESLPIRLNNVDYQVETQVLSTTVSNFLVEVQVTVNWTRGKIPQTIQMTAFYSKK